jgi:spermidine/putrescine transport system substrate-binding protein
MVFLLICLSVSLSGCGKKFYLFNWTYYTPESVIKKFEKEFNVTVILDEYDSNEIMYAKLMNAKKGRYGYDMVIPSGDYVSIMIAQDMFENIDHSKIPNLANIDPAIIKKISYDQQMRFAIPYYYGAAGIAVNTAMVPDFERSWSIFERNDLRNRMTMLDDMREVMGDALVFLNYSVNSKDPGQVDAAKDLINNVWKPNLVKFDAESFGKGFANGDFWVVQGYAEVVFEEILENKDMLAKTVFFIPHEGGPAYIDSMCILKGSKNIELAHEFINFIHRPEIYAEFCDDWGFPATVNIPARQLKKGLSLYQVEDLVNTELKDDLGDALKLYDDAWTRSIKVGN